MIVVTANWLCSDGSTFGPPGTSAVARFVDDVAAIATRAGVGPDGRYAPLERLDVVLAGDTFDWLSSDRWVFGGRPWRSDRRSCEARTAIATAAVLAARPLLQPLAALAQDGVRVPAADRRGRPTADRSLTVPVVVTVLPGDRDAAIERMSLGRIEPYAALAFGSVWERIGPAGSVVVRHGHEFDPLCDGEQRSGDGHGGDPADGFMTIDDRPPTLSESLLVDLVAAFAVRIRGLAVPVARRRSIVGSLARGHLVDLPMVLHKTLAKQANHAHELLEAWKRSVDAWRRAARSDPPASPTGFDAVDALASWLDSVPTQGVQEAEAACADGWLEIRSIERARAKARGGRPGGLVLGHPSSDLSQTGGSSLVTLGPPRVHPRSKTSSSPTDVHEVAVERSGGEDDMAWAAIPAHGPRRAVASAGLWLDAA